jgi:hypothetical protein
VAVTDLFVFLRSLASHWGVLMTGGIPMAILALWEHWKGQSISWGVFSIGALVFALWAAYLAWKDQHRKCVALSREVERLRPTRPPARDYVDGGLVTLRFRDQMGAPSPPQKFSFVAE